MGTRSKYLPLLLIFLTVLALALTNIKPGTYFSGWDNFHPEFDFWNYAKRELFGAWVAFQGTGAPASQSQIAEITRLPVVLILKLLLPQNLVRYAFHLLMVLIGGIGIYWYLTQIWLTKTKKGLRNWIAALGAVFYILNITTLQQFYISFEVFAVEFAFLPFVFLSIHWLCERVDKRSVLTFIIIQLLIAPYGFVPTIFYFAAIFYVIYGFFVNLQVKKNLVDAIKSTVGLSLLIFFVNAYWLLPNVYYTLHNSRYVYQSQANSLFDLEALWSVREAGTLQNFLTGFHFIFNWQHFNFNISQYEFNYKDWSNHLSNQLTLLTLLAFTLITHVGLIKLALDRFAGKKRWGFIIIFIIITILIWMGLFIPNKIFNLAFSFGIIQNSLRNLYTKLSTIYSFLLAILFSLFFEYVSLALLKSPKRLLSKTAPKVIIALTFCAIFFSSWPSFTGNYIDQQLKVSYPKEYFEMFSFLHTKPVSDRVLELPYLSQDGWILYDWTKIGKPEGYQGMGFYYFGMPQALITPDFARWTETTDFFYHELRYTFNSQNATQLKYLLDKYNVSLVIVDETVMRKYMKNYNYQIVYKMLNDAGYSKVWQKNFLSVYEGANPHKKDDLIIPSEISFINADTARVRRDFAYEQYGGYIESKVKSAEVLYPFINLSALYVKDAIINQNGAYIERFVPESNYTLIIPGIKESIYSTLSQISYKDNSIDIIFPKNQVNYDGKILVIPNLEDIHINVDTKYDSIYLIFNNQQFHLDQGQTITPVLTSNTNSPITVDYLGVQNMPGRTDVTNPIAVDINQPDWNEFETDLKIQVDSLNMVKIETMFPTIYADLKKFPSDNCTQSKYGKTPIVYTKDRVIYQAEDYGVNCSYYNFDYFTPNTSYLLQVSGKNDQGRSIKFYINYNSQNTVPEEYLMPKKDYTATLTLLPVTSYSPLSYALNWETRSYGMLDQNELKELKYAPFPLDRFSQIRLEKLDYQGPLKNDVSQSTGKSYLYFLYLIDGQCKTESCYLGIDQSYDDLWIAIDSQLHILPHFRYNNWANLWKLNSSGKIVVVYIPQVVSSLSLLSLCIFIVILVIKLRRSKIYRHETN